MTGLLPARLIEKKRDGGSLSPAELEWFFRAFLVGEVPDYQMSAFLMAVYFCGLSRGELETLLSLMIGSGAVLDLSYLPGPRVDKHSTGGVGDKTSLVLAPLVAVAGGFVPMISGRGLGHTTGTLDKLESIPGFRTRLPVRRFQEILGEVGVAMMGQTDEVVPLDRCLYALRDATASVPSIPLIAASILSKKLAEGIGGLVLDVKTGAGSFLPDPEDGLSLARTMVELGEGRGVRTVALLTRMDAPLGGAVGNGLEAREALECLRGEGPADVTDLSLTLAGEMLWAGGLASSPGEGKDLARRALEDGRGLERMTRLVEAQGGDPRVVEDPRLLPKAPCHTMVEASEKGFVEEIDPLALGHGVVEMGGGRSRVEDEIDPRVGFLLHVSPGDRVGPGTPLGEVHAAEGTGLERGRQILRRAITLGPDPPPVPDPLIRARVTVQG
ncbi:MAG: thymidine phosphorylase [Longimicrobiales bacterium]